MGSKIIRITDLKHWVVLCAQHDIVMQADGTMVLAREGIAGMWAMIVPKRGSTFSREGYVVQDPGGGKREIRSHIVTIRQRADLDITAFAWVYERKRQSPSRWFKLLGTMDTHEDGRFTSLDVVMLERGDTQSPVARVESDSPLPPGDNLGPVAPPSWVKL